MTPFGHASVSYLAGARWKHAWLPGVIAGGLLLDIDFLLLPFPFFNQIHRVATHNVFFVLLLALIGGLAAKSSRQKVALSILAGGLLHLLIDSMMDDNPTNGIGVALFWPVSARWYSPFNLTPPLPGAAGWDDLAGRIRGVWRSLIWELPFYLAVAYLWSRNKKGLRATQTRIDVLPAVRPARSRQEGTPPRAGPPEE